MEAARNIELDGRFTALRRLGPPCLVPVRAGESVSGVPVGCVVVMGRRGQGRTSALIQMWREASQRGERPGLLVAPHWPTVIRASYLNGSFREDEWARERCVTFEQVAQGSHIGVGIDAWYVDNWDRMTERHRERLLEDVAPIVAVTL